MSSFFCSEASRLAQEDLIGTVMPYRTYVLIECPMPWTANALESKLIPDSLRQLVQAVQQSGLPIRFLLVNQGQHPTATRVLIYRQSSGRFCKGYHRWETSVEHLEQVAGVIQAQLAIRELPCESHWQTDQNAPPIRDLLICVHGSHDRCCARYGIPFYRDAVALQAQLGLEQVRIWKASHFGGHRFAPTLLDFPDGRCYGRLDRSLLQSILMRSGPIDGLKSIYRGWSILPPPLQVLERELMLNWGWDWFRYPIATRVVERTEMPGLQAELSVLLPDGQVREYAAELIPDPEQSRCLLGSCHAAQPTEYIKYAIQSLRTSKVALPEPQSSAVA
ncbi:MAG: sucrase ferredoxin [Synechococcales cyanobacterium M58_A2018_015]|nr:sucrase ferredoxin [Synechococcales cyanobacterium M58_A2018_015]